MASPLCSEYGISSSNTTAVFKLQFNLEMRYNETQTRSAAARGPHWAKYCEYAGINNGKSPQKSRLYGQLSLGCSCASLVEKRAKRFSSSQRLTLTRQAKVRPARASYSNMAAAVWRRMAQSPHTGSFSTNASTLPLTLCPLSRYCRTADIPCCSTGWLVDLVCAGR